MLSSSGGSDGWNKKLRAYERRQARKRACLESSCIQSCEQDTAGTCQTLETVPSAELKAGEKRAITQPARPCKF
eukprot:6186591-Pleurochrysis_carterae.AAC.1